MSDDNGVSNLRGKCVIVTGSSMGIGQAVALRLAREGAKVVINGRSMEALEVTLDLISSQGGEAVACCGSVANYDIANKLTKKCVNTYGGVDVLINCAGIAEPQNTSILDIDPVDWQQLIDIHLHGTFNTCRLVAPIMAEQGGGTIINTSSHAFLGVYGGTGYAAGKGAVNSLSYAMAVDLADAGINVNVVCPGAKTRLSSGNDFENQIESLHRRGVLTDERRLSALNPASPEYVASLYAVLSSDLARDITGQIFWGSGGYIGYFTPNGQETVAAMEAGERPPWEIDALWKVLSERHGAE